MSKAKNQEKNQKKNPSNAENSQESVSKIFESEFESTSLKLSRTYSRFLQSKNIWQRSLTPKSLFLQWLEYYHQWVEEDLLTGNQKINKIPKEIDLSHSPTEKILFQNFNFFKGSIYKWPLRLENKFVQKAREIPHLSQFLYFFMSVLLQGNFYHSNIKITYLQDINTIPYMAFFHAKFYDKKLILFCINVEKNPILDKYGKNLLKFEFLHTLRFLDILKEKDISNLKSNIMPKIFQKLINDPCKGDFIEELQEDSKFSYSRTQNHFFNLIKVHGSDQLVFNDPFSEENLKLHANIAPNIFKPLFLSKTESTSMVFDTNSHRWISSDLKLIGEKKVFLDCQRQINQEILKQYADFSSAGKLVELLEKIPNFKLKLTAQERSVIGQDGNVLAIGRSGTGKTTCAILRIFSMEILFKIRVTLYQNKMQGVLKDTRFEAEDLERTIGLHCMFVTSSPVLTNEVGRYYEKLTKHVKDELKKKQRKKDNINENKDCSEYELIQEVEKELEKEKNEEKYHSKEENEDLMKKIKQFTSLNEMKEENFPAFVTMKCLIIMIDGCLQRPFFTRNKDGQIIGGDSGAYWHNENQGVLMIEHYHKKGGEEEEIKEEEDEEKFEYENEEELEMEYQRMMYLAQKKNKKQTVETSEKSNKKKKLAFEVDFDYFDTYFWPKVQKRYHNTSISSTAVWTEIYSYIKGSATSHLSPGQNLSEKEYLDLVSEKKSLISLETRKQIFEIYCMYERWKIDQGAYDILDVVNYILTQIRFGRYCGNPIHYLMIDEVQDLPHAILLLMAKITEQGLFFAGDTAQNIAKGVGFRFCDLQHVFDKNNFPGIEMKKPVVRHLTVNFRSHARILDLANSVVSVLEHCFPKTIDKLKKEKSNLDGPKPILLEHGGLDLLFLVLFGEKEFKNQKNEGFLSKPQIEFGCNQVIIVRDQKSKEKIPRILEHALILTIYEAKGLEFDDVILYNFFEDSQMEGSKWGLLNHLYIQDNLMTKEDFLKEITIHENGEKQNLNELEVMEENEKEEKFYGSKEINGKILVKNIRANKSLYTVDINSYSILCNELKLLYTAITRPRNKLIIFDENLDKRAMLAIYWQSLDLVQTISKDVLENIDQKNNETNIFQSILQRTSPEQWRIQGEKMLKHKYYEQAIICFEKSGDTVLLQRAKAFSKADNATKSLSKIDAERMYISENLFGYEEMKKQKKKELKIQLKNQEMSAIYDLKNASEIFMSIGLKNQAAQCLFSAKEYKKAAEIYEELEMWKQAGDAYILLENYLRAAELFEKSGDYIRVIECYEWMNKWEYLLETVQRFRFAMKPEEKDKFIKKYVPLALEELVQQVVFQNEEENVQEKEDEIILEENENDDEDSESDLNSPEPNIIPHEEKESIQKNEIKIIEKENPIPQSPLENLNKDNTSLIDKISLDQTSVIENITLNESHPQSHEEINKHLDKLEHLSGIDLNDEWLKTEKGSILSSLSSIRKENSVHQSDYSAVEYSEFMANHAAIVKTKTDIYAQDVTMQKIIKYVSMISDEFRKNLMNIRSKSSLLTEKIRSDSEYDYLIDFAIDLDNIDTEFLHSMLDILETFKIYKLCIFICNRYRLAKRIGRYLVAISLKYSPLALEKNWKLNISFFSKFINNVIGEKAFISQTAFHNVLENMNPEYLKSNILGEECFKQLLMLGFWKKIAFLMDVKKTSAITRLFCDFNTCRSIKDEPIIRLEQIIWNSGIVNKYYNSECEITNYKNEFFIEKLIIKNDFDILLSSFVKKINEFYDNLSKYNNNNIDENIIFMDNLASILYSLHETDFKLIQGLEARELTLFIIILSKIIKQLYSSTKNSNTIIKTMTLFFRSKLPDEEILGFLGRNWLILDKYSAIFNDFIEKNDNLYPLDIDQRFFIVKYEVGIKKIIFKTVSLMNKCVNEYAKKHKKTENLENSIYISFLYSQIQVLIKYFNLNIEQQNKIKIPVITHKKDIFSKKIIKIGHIDEEIDSEEEKKNEKMKEKQINEKFLQDLYNCFIERGTIDFILEVKEFLISKSIELFNVNSINDILTKKLGLCFEILKLMGEEIIFAELLRKKLKISPYKSFSKLLDSEGYKKFGCIEEFSENFFEYFAANFKITTLREKIYRFQDAMIFILIAYKTSFNTENSILIHSYMLNYIEKYVKINENTYKLWGCIGSLTQRDEILYELYFWIRKLIEISEFKNKYKEIIINIFEVVFINTNEFTPQISQIINEIIETNIFKENFKIQKKDIKKSRDILLESKKNLIRLNFENNQDDIDENYQKSDQNYYKQINILLKRIQSQKKIKKMFIKKGKTVKKTKNLCNFYFCKIISFNLKIFNTHKSFLMKNSFIFELYESLDNCITDTLTTFYQFSIENSFDFYYLQSQLSYLEGFALELDKKITEFSLEIPTNKEINQFFVLKKKELESLKNNFEIWKNITIKEEKIDDLKMKKNKQMIALGFAQKGLMSRANLIVKKRAGLKRQKLLQEKKEREKMKGNLSFALNKKN